MIIMLSTHQWRAAMLADRAPDKGRVGPTAATEGEIAVHHIAAGQASRRINRGQRRLNS